MFSASAPGPYKMLSHEMNAADTTCSVTAHELLQGQNFTSLQQQGSTSTRVCATPLPAVPRPEKYDGELVSCRGSLLQC